MINKVKTKEKYYGTVGNYERIEELTNRQLVSALIFGAFIITGASEDSDVLCETSVELADQLLLIARTHHGD